MTQSFRTLWISDTHLGGKNVRSDKLYQFLQQTESEYLYLVGDIFDLWKVQKGGCHWPEVNDKIITNVLEKAAAGTKVIYIPGNHDEALRRYAGSQVNGVQFALDAVHTTADGQRLLVLHGDLFDCVVQNRKWLADLGSVLYEVLLDVNRIYNRWRQWRGKEYWSLSAALKQCSKNIVNYMGSFEEVLSNEIARREVDGIVCGHIHYASLRNLGNAIYANSGDWVESCTALAENHNGCLGIINQVQPDFESATLERAHGDDRIGDRCLAPTN